MSMHDYIKEKEFPLFICPGCTHGTVTNAFLHVASQMNLDKNNTVLVSAIGCAGRIPVFLDFNVLRVTHGRALAFATGVKLAKPEVKVIVFMGDGDAVAIGGNHFIHAARRNIDLTAVVCRNEIYGMTGGQYAPTTPMGCKAVTAPYGMLEPTFDVCDLAAGAGATYVARCDAYHVIHLQKTLKKAMDHKGFSMVEVVTSCPTQFGRRNKMPDPVDMLNDIKNSSIMKEEAEKLSKEELDGKNVIGEFVNIARPELCDSFMKLVERRKSK